MQIKYVLKLEDNKWYIGKTFNIQKRFNHHKNGTGAQWTKLHKPICIYSKSYNISERELTLQYMKKYGIENVRGYSWSNRILSDQQVQFIKNCLKYR